MNILLLSCYELGHQPLNLAWPLAVLRSAGYAPSAVDLAVQSFPETAARQAEFAGISVPMHTALRLGVQASERIRRANPEAHICFYGLYAWLNREYLLGQGIADSVLAGEVENALLELVRSLDGNPGEQNGGQPTRAPAPLLARLQYPLPARGTLPGLSEYARLEENGTAFLAGYTESSRGCLHTCRHCPVVPVYQGRFFAVPLDTVLADIQQQVAAGARHITFGDPDFLNGRTHALRISRALHADFPQVTFDFTTKVEHILKHAAILPELRSLGAAFLVSAFESTSDEVLARLDKGHTLADMERALQILAAAGLPVQPTWLPFTPWTSLAHYLDMLTWIREHRLIPNVAAVQYSVRLLVPPESALLDAPDTAKWLGDLDPENFSYHWQHPDPRMDALQARLASWVEGASIDPYANFQTVERLAYQAAGARPPSWRRGEYLSPAPPRLTEDWFC